MRATTCTVPDRAILQSFIEEEKACQVKVWFSRVPTSANVSDAPSRLDTGENGHLRCYQSVVSQSTLWDMLGKSRIETLGFRRRDPAVNFPNCNEEKRRGTCESFRCHCKFLEHLVWDTFLDT